MLQIYNVPKMDGTIEPSMISISIVKLMAALLVGGIYLMEINKKSQPYPYCIPTPNINDLIDFTFYNS